MKHQKRQVAKPVPPASQVRGAIASVATKGNRHFSETQARELGFHNQFGGEFHAGRAQVELEDFFA